MTGHAQTVARIKQKMKTNSGIGGMSKRCQQVGDAGFKNPKSNS